MQSLLRKNIEDLEGYTPGEQPKRSDLIKLNTNENPYPPSPRGAGRGAQGTELVVAPVPRSRGAGAAEAGGRALQRPVGERHGRQRLGRAPVHPDALLRERRGHRRLPGPHLQPVRDADRHPGRTEPHAPLFGRLCDTGAALLPVEQGDDPVQPQRSLGHPGAGERDRPPGAFGGRGS